MTSMNFRLFGSWCVRFLAMVFDRAEIIASLRSALIPQGQYGWAMALIRCSGNTGGVIGVS